MELVPKVTSSICLHVYQLPSHGFNDVVSAAPTHAPPNLAMLISPIHSTNAPSLSFGAYSNHVPTYLDTKSKGFLIEIPDNIGSHNTKVMLQALSFSRFKNQTQNAFKIGEQAIYE